MVAMIGSATICRQNTFWRSGQMIREVDGKLVIMGNLPSPGTGFGRSLSSANFQVLGGKPASTPPATQAQTPLAPSNKDTPAKP